MPLRGTPVQTTPAACLTCCCRQHACHTHHTHACHTRWNERFIEAKLSMVDRAAKVDAVAEQVRICCAWSAVAVTVAPRRRAGASLS
jgi:hypothetical protein